MTGTATFDDEHSAPDLSSVPNKLLVDGRWCDASNGEFLAIIDPSTEAVIDHVPMATGADVDAALAAAQRGFERWREAGAWDRSAVLRRAAALIVEYTEQIAHTLTAEQGKPLAEARGEIMAAAEQFDWYADEARRLYGRLIPAHSSQERISVLKQPVGPVAAFSAWNFPVLLPARKIAPALAAGCSVILKPAEEAPRTGLWLGRILLEAGLPSGVLNILTGPPAPIAEQLLRSSIIRKVSLTGSVAVGRTLLHLAAEDVKAVSMELGGHAPVLIFGDADIGAAAQAIVLAKFRNAGQVCISPSRFFVQESVSAQLLDQVTARVKALRVAPGHEPNTDVGPLTTQRRLDAVETLVDDAVNQGAALLAGGRRSQRAGYFYEPTVLAEARDSMQVMQEEPFGPIAPFTTFAESDEVLARANATPYGLAGFVFTRDLRTAQLAAEGLEVGMVGVNQFVIATAEAPFGGVKSSGFGREGGTEGIESYTITKYVSTRL